MFEGKVWVYAIILAFSGSDRLGLQLYGGNSILTLTFEYTDESNLGWSAPVWEPDESREWESHTTFDKHGEPPPWKR